MENSRKKERVVSRSAPLKKAFIPPQLEQHDKLVDLTFGTLSTNGDSGYG